MGKKIGFIGVGNMGTPMITRLLGNKIADSAEMFVFDIDENTGKTNSVERFRVI